MHTQAHLTCVQALFRNAHLNLSLLTHRSGWNSSNSGPKTEIENTVTTFQCGTPCYRYVAPDTPVIVVSPKDDDKNLRIIVLEEIPFLYYAVHNVLAHSELEERRGISQREFIKDFISTSRLSTWSALSNLLERYKIRRYSSDARLLYILVGEKHVQTHRYSTRKRY